MISRYRQEIAWVALAADLFLATDEDKVPMLNLLSLSAAFVTVYQEILLTPYQPDTSRADEISLA